MPATKKNTTRKKIKTVKPARGVIKPNTFGKTTLFPEKLAKLNALLETAVLLPH